MATKGRAPAWEEPISPSLLSSSAFRVWQERNAKHCAQRDAPYGCTDFAKYEKEVEAMMKMTLGHDVSRRFVREERHATVRKGNEKVGQKLFDIDVQSQRRKQQIWASDAAFDAKPGRSMNSSLRRKQQVDMFAENAALVQRIESTRAVVPSATQLARSYDRHASIVAARRKRYQRGGSVSASCTRPPLSCAKSPARSRPRQPGGPRRPQGGSVPPAAMSQQDFSRRLVMAEEDDYGGGGFCVGSGRPPSPGDGSPPRAGGPGQEEPGPREPTPPPPLAEGSRQSTKQQPGSPGRGEDTNCRSASSITNKRSSGGYSDDGFPGGEQNEAGSRRARSSSRSEYSSSRSRSDSRSSYSSRSSASKGDD